MFIQSLGNALRLSAQATDLTKADMEEGGWFQQQCEVAITQAFSVGAKRNSWNDALLENRRKN